MGAEFSGITPRELGIQSALVSAPLLLAWLILFWRMAASAGLERNIRHLMRELAWTIGALALLIAANYQLGPEVAGMAASGPLIVLQFWLDERPDRKRWRSMLAFGLPYVVLIVGLAATRAVPS
ncbi:hypothetical protein GTW51_22605 [Aurantimonas aggregata]|uniref:Uncharacterized protein n=1 Tax=Aurantimonas aggregata TaxID=2047720 RepID=A0A6L9MPG9_9HYPH|nr:hypothetical protein [Aurantimonas aggregata]